MGHMIDTKNKETKVFVEKFGRSDTFAVWPVNEAGEKVGSYPIVSMGVAKAKACLKHLDEMKEFVEGKLK